MVDLLASVDDVRVRRRRIRMSATARLVMLASAAVVVAAVFLLTDLPAAWQYVLPLRAEKLLTMVVVAVAIATSTVLFQTITTNRILTPGIMGFDALYVLIQTLGVAVFGATTLTLADAGLKFAVQVAVMVAGVVLLSRWLFFGRRRDLHLLVLVGIVFGTLFRSVSSFVARMLDPAEFAVLQNSLFASFTTVDPELLLIATVVVAAVGAVLFAVRRSFDVLALGQDTAIGLGVDHRRVVMTILVLVAVLVAVSTALVGPITFFGLLVANLAYTVVGDRHARSIPAAIALGVLALVGGQLLLERVFGFASSLSVIIEFLGGVMFIALVLARRSR